MTDLAEFLLARIGEDEAAARAAEASWASIDLNYSENDGYYPRTKPARVLAECEAKRRVVELDICTACAVEGQPCDHRESTLRLFALPYVDHPDYRQEWRP